MQIKNLKTKISAIVIIAIFFASIATIAVPAKAQSETGPHGMINEKSGGSIPLPSGVTPDVTFDSIAHMSFRPNPVGVGQPILVNVWMTPPIHVSHYFAEFDITLTKPDGTQDVIKKESYRADGTAWFEYTPDQAGNWTIKFDFPGAFYPAGNYTVFAGAFFSQTSDTVVSFPQSCYYKPSHDGPYTFTVQSDMVASWPATPLPTDYWTRPISIENRDWWTIAGNYPATGILGGGPTWPANTNPYMSNYLFTPYVQAPNSAHIVWKRQDAFGGLIGGQWGQESFTTSGGSPTIIFQGRCYQSITKVNQSTVNAASQSYWQCYDLRTGQVYWERPVLSGETLPSFIIYEKGRAEVPGGDPVFGQTIYFGAIASGSRLVKYSPYTGAVASNSSISPITSGTYYMPEQMLSIQTLGSGASTQYRLINWTTSGTSDNFTVRMYSNISWPFSSIGTADFQTGVAVSSQAITSQATGNASNAAGLAVAIGYYLVGVNLKTGAIMWNVSTVNVPAEYGDGGFFSGSTAVADQGKFAIRLNDGHWHAWDLMTGAHLWKGELSSWPWGTFGCYGVQSYGGMILSNQYDGVCAYNWTNGKLVWQYKSPAPYPYETPYQAEYAWFTGTTRIADGKLFTYNTEHTASEPITRGWRLHCINITTGAGIWNITGSMAPGGVADGYLTAGNSYDGFMYVFGKGKSATTVSAPQVSITQGQSLVVSGTVLDQSPAQAGTPCVSKQSMTQWMEYLHMQHAMPSTVIGVPVSLDAVDPNGNSVHIATVNSDASGTYSFVWTPDNAGKYTVTATFMGDDSYGSSWAETAVNVANAPAATTSTPSPTPLVMPPYEIYTVGTGVAIIIAIAVAVLFLRKRP